MIRGYDKRVHLILNRILLTNRLTCSLDLQIFWTRKRCSTCKSIGLLFFSNLLVNCVLLWTNKPTCSLNLYSRFSEQSEACEKCSKSIDECFNCERTLLLVMVKPWGYWENHQYLSPCLHVKCYGCFPSWGPLTRVEIAIEMKI